jgi:DNA-binding transcriptional LysR family regulator
MDWKFLVDHNETSLSLVKQGHAITVLDREVALPSVKEGSISIWPKFQHTAKIYLACQKKRTSEKLIATYLKTAKEAFAAEGDKLVSTN